MVHGLPGARTCLVLDAGVSGKQALLGGKGFAVQEEVSSPTTMERASRLGKRLRESGVNHVLCIGGGNAMDLAKLAVAMAATPSLEGQLARHGDRGGVVIVPQTVVARTELSFVPTTLGTGSEVNTAACYEVDRGDNILDKNLVMLQGLRTSAVAYDPDFLRAPSWLIAEGLFEPIVRLLTSLVEGNSESAFADWQGKALLAAAWINLAAGRANGFEPEDGDLVSSAMLSAESHSSWALRGRGPAPSSLWFLANELSMALGVRKNEASALLLGPWVGAVLASREVWGSKERLLQLWPELSGVSGRSVADALAWPFLTPNTRRRVITLSGDEKVALSHDLASRTMLRFGHGRPMKKELIHSELADLFEAGLTVPDMQESGAGR